MLWLGIVKITYWVHNNNLLMKSIPIQYRHGYPNPTLIIGHHLLHIRTYQKQIIWKNHKILLAFLITSQQYISWKIWFVRICKAKGDGQ